MEAVSWKRKNIKGPAAKIKDDKKSHNRELEEKLKIKMWKKDEEERKMLWEQSVIWKQETAWDEHKQQRLVNIFAGELITTIVTRTVPDNTVGRWHSSWPKRCHACLSIHYNKVGYANFLKLPNKRIENQVEVRGVGAGAERQDRSTRK